MPFQRVLGQHDPARPVHRRVSIRGVLRRPDGTVLMVTTKAWGDFCFPGGGQERGETDEDTLIREMGEETGVLVRRGSLRLLGQVDLFKPDRDDPAWEFHQLTRYYLCESEGMGRPHLSRSEVRDALSARYVDPAEALKSNLALTKPGMFWLPREEIVLRYLLAGTPEETGGK